MLNKNFYSYMRVQFQTGTAEFTKWDGSKTFLERSSSDTYALFNVMNKWSSNNAGMGVSFGTGTTPATVEDYWLESALGDTRISVSNPSTVIFSRGDTFDEYSVSFGITNKTSDAITISEVGLIPSVSDSSYNIGVLVDRTVLDAPVTIPANETKHIAYTIRFNYGV